MKILIMIYYNKIPIKIYKQIIIKIMKSLSNNKLTIKFIKKILLNQILINI
jgi:hypothetical protein